MAEGKKDVFDETTGEVVASGVTDAQAKKISSNLASSHKVTVKQHTQGGDLPPVTPPTE